MCYKVSLYFDGLASFPPGLNIYILNRVAFGPNHLYVFHHPQDLAKKVNAGEKIETPTFDTAQEEIAKSSGLMTCGDGKSIGDYTVDFEINVLRSYHLGASFKCYIQDVGSKI